MGSCRSPRELSARAVSAFAAGLGIAYPGLVYFGHGRVPPWLFAVALPLLLGARRLLGRNWPDPLAPVLLAAGCAALALALVAPELGVRFYPVLVNGAMCVVFGVSLLRPPSVVERIARALDPGLPAGASRYLRNVTIAWCLFFLANGSAAAWTAILGSLEAWTLYNGVIGYLLTAAMFAGELVARRLVTRSALVGP